ncbi:hypothetical protein [Streptomyces tendae]|nr:hypothetical protein [Streptomyces tendae]
MASSRARRARRPRRRRAPVWSALIAFAVVGATATGAVYWQGHARPGAGGAVSSSASAP